MSIHPAAMVAPDAELGERVEVGPFAVIERGVRVGDDSVIEAHAVVCAGTTLGRGNRVGYSAVIGGDPQDLKYQRGTPTYLEIGDGNHFREHVTVHRGTVEGSRTVIGSNNYLMAGAHVGHNSVLGDHVILANTVLLGGHVQIADGVFVGGGTVFHQFTRVGRMVICQGDSGFSKDIPPFCMAAGRNMVAGLNVIGLRRAGFTSGKRLLIKRAFRALFASGAPMSEALKQGMAEVESGGGGEAAEELREFWGFVKAAGAKGVCRLSTGRRGGSAASDE
jgi:UDP-N-acetylglucosamine acyltransferase